MYVPDALWTAEAVYVRTDSVRRPLQRPYTGPFKVVGRAEKYFTINQHGQEQRVSIDRLKPAYGLQVTEPPPDAGEAQQDDFELPQAVIHQEVPDEDFPPLPEPRHTRSGRAVIPPARYRE